MILFCAVAVVLFAILVYYLKMEVISEKSFTVDCTLTKGMIFDFLKTPTNLEKIHPRIQKVLDVRTENNAISFQIEEDMGKLFGKKTFPMRLTTLCDVSNLTSSIRLDSESRVADVAVTLTISGYDSALPESQAREMLARDPPASTIQGRITVKAMRIVNSVISRYLLSIWDKTIRATLDLLNKESDNFCRKKVS